MQILALDRVVASPACGTSSGAFSSLAASSCQRAFSLLSLAYTGSSPGIKKQQTALDNTKGGSLSLQSRETTLHVSL